MKKRIILHTTFGVYPDSKNTAYSADIVVISIYSPACLTIGRKIRNGKYTSNKKGRLLSDQQPAF